MDCVYDRRFVEVDVIIVNLCNAAKALGSKPDNFRVISLIRELDTVPI